MAIRGFSCPYGEGDVSFEQCLAHSKTDPPECGFTYPILAGMVTNLRPEMEEVTVTQLLNCIRKPVLERRHDVFLEPQQLFYAFRGQMFHQIAQMAAEVGLADCVVEQRFKRVVAGVSLSGQPDLISPALRKLWDFKTTRRVPANGKVYPHHAMQVNIYRYLVQVQHPIDQLEVVYLDMNEVVRATVEVMPVRSVVAWLVPRLKQLRAGLDGGKLPPKVGAEGLWQCKGYCAFTERCWPGGVPSPAELRRKGQAKTKAVLQALGRAG